MNKIIKFQRGKLLCWIGANPFDYYNTQDSPPLLEFESIDALKEFVYNALPYTKTSTLHQLEIRGHSVLWGSCIGWIK